MKSAVTKGSPCFSFVSLLLILGLALAQVSCQPTYQKIEPKIDPPLALTVHHLQTLPSAFPPISAAERKEEWAKELLIGEAFAKEWDLYRAITCYKRALVLLPPQERERRLQLDYDLILCYYLGNKYQEALNLFEASDLSQADPRFPAFHDLLLLVYDCYLQTDQEKKAAGLFYIIQQFSQEEESENILLYQTLKKGEIQEVHDFLARYSRGESLAGEFAAYGRFAKSPEKARFLNAVLPGAGYYYVGQKKSALTSFIINALFTAAAYQFFRNGYPAVGLITASLEMGWYVGGINGAGIEAAEFNHRLYEGVSRKMLTEQKAFPMLMFKMSF